MVLVVDLNVARQRIVKHAANRFVVGFLIDQAMSTENALGVGVHNERDLLTRVKQNRIGCFRANAGDA